jgi:preprotein translocase subunit SecE
LRTYLHEVRQEMRKVTWPTRDQMIAFTAVTLITSTVLTAVVFGLDVVMKEFVFWLLTRS